MKDVLTWIEQDKIIFFQKYDPFNNLEDRRPYVMVIQTPWMQSLAKEITINSSWAIDSTFKTNQYGLLLYAAMCSNEHGVGMLIFFMLCSTDVGSKHESMALMLTLTTVFRKMEGIRPNAIVIDKISFVQRNYWSWWMVLER
jgi:hypothetical protein